MRHNSNYLIVAALFIAACGPSPPEISEESKQDTRNRMVEVNKIMLAKDKKRIEGYIQRMKYPMEESETGLWYEILDPGQGDSVRTGDRVEIKYRVKLLDGTECYNSDKDGTKKFQAGRGGVESGLEEGILLLSLGGKARFIIPPHLGYGLPGDGNKIPARAILIYELEVLAIE
jgi:FKBP-type peptidyl-prolyl cis-trans isomerase